MKDLASANSARKLWHIPEICNISEEMQNIKKIYKTLLKSDVFYLENIGFHFIYNLISLQND